MTSEGTSDPRLVPRRLGHAGPYVSELCVGTSPLGGMPTLYGYDADADTAIATGELQRRERAANRGSDPQGRWSARRFRRRDKG